MLNAIPFTAQTQRTRRDHEDRVRSGSVRLLCAVGVIALMGLSSCALSADRGTNTQTQNTTPARQDDSQNKAAAKKQAPADPNKFAIIVAGVGGEEAYTKKFTAQASKLYEGLTAQL